MQSVKFMNPVSFLTKTIHLIFDNIDRKKSEIIKWMWIWIEMQSDVSSIALAIISIDILISIEYQICDCSYVWKLAGHFFFIYLSMDLYFDVFLV